MWPKVWVCFAELIKTQNRSILDGLNAYRHLGMKFLPVRKHKRYISVNSNRSGNFKMCQILTSLFALKQGMIGRQSVLVAPRGEKIKLCKFSLCRCANHAVWLSFSAVALTFSFSSCNCKFLHT